MPELTLSGRYGLFDPDRTVRGDGSQRVTLAAQYIFMENGSLELFYWLNIANDDRDTTSTDRQLEGTDQLILMSHFGSDAIVGNADLRSLLPEVYL